MRLPWPVKHEKPPPVPVAAEVPVFASLHAAQLYLAGHVGIAIAASLAGDVYSHWGPKICSDGWHLDKWLDGRVKITECDCEGAVR